MSGSDLIRDERVECLDHEATATGFRRRFRTTSVTDCESWIEATYDPYARRITVMEHELTAFRTGHAPVENSWRRLSLTLDEAQALNNRLCQLLAEAKAGAA